MTVILTKCYSGDQINMIEVGDRRVAYMGKEEMQIEFWWET
jgi:hypothetical protein